jgi:hypothetical protein
MKSPDAVELQAAIWPDSGFVDRDGVEGFDGMKADIRKARRRFLDGHS